MSIRTPGSSSAPPPPRRPGPGEDALTEWLDISGRRAAATPNGASPSQDSLLKILTDLGGRAPVDELQKRSRLRFVEFTEALLQMEDAGRVLVTGAPGQETVTTEGGAG
jgi:hypothetical protein